MCGLEGGGQTLEQRGFVLYIVQGVGHEDAVEVGKAESGGGEVGGAGLDGDAVWCCLSGDARPEVDGLDVAA